MEGEIMFNLLYKKYKNDILKFSAWEEFKKLRFYEKAFLIEVIFCAILEYFFAFISKLNGFVVVLVILLFCFIAFKVKRNKTEEQNGFVLDFLLDGNEDNNSSSEKTFSYGDSVMVKRNGKVGVIVDSDGNYHTVKLKDENENEYYESFYSDELDEY